MGDLTQKVIAGLCVLASWREISLRIVTLAVALTPAAAATGNVRIRALSPHEFLVTAAYEHPPALRFAAFGEGIQDLNVTSLNQPVVFELQQEGRFLGLVVSSAASGLEIRYRVNSPEGRLPLLVPLQESSGTALHLRLELASGLQLIGDSFPRFEPASGRLEAELANHPSLAHLPIGRQGSSGPWMTPGMLANLGLISMTLAVAACWLWLGRGSGTGAEALKKADQGR